MQVLVIAVQNAVEYRDLGVATSGNTLFRSIGGSVGTAVLGAIFAARLGAELAGRLPGGGGAAEGGTGLSLHAIAQVPAAVRAQYAQAFTASIDTIFLVAAVVAIVGFALSWLLPERPLRETVAATSADVGQEVGGAMAMPTAPEPYEELVRGLAAIVDRDLRRRYIERIVAKAGVGLSAAAAWLLVRLDEQPDASLDRIARQSPFGADALRRAADELCAAGLIASVPNGGTGRWRLTSTGCAVLDRIVAARRAHLAEVFAQWTPREQQELTALLRRLTTELVPEARSRSDSAGATAATDGA
jgi:DNA-binding MarR family transcriptional regulator